ncbi:MAG: helix-turn-helix transcriptional regulator [Thalassovita sp.]
MTYPIKYGPGDAMERFSILCGEEALLKLMGGTIKRQKLPRAGEFNSSPEADAKRARVLACLREHGPMTCAEIAASIDLKPANTKYTVSSLFKTGALERTNPKARKNLKWRIVE